MIVGELSHHSQQISSNRLSQGTYHKAPFFPVSLLNAACDEGPDLFAHLLKVFSVMLIITTLPFSLFFAVKVVQEYERAVIFRLGRLVSGGARGPGVFFVIPCLDIYEKIDMRTSTYDVPPQEVKIKTFGATNEWIFLDPNKGLCDGLCQRHHVLQGEGRHPGCGQRG